jgi:FkbM family methyltransferase
MKLRNVLEFAGLRGKAKHYGYRTRSVDLGGDGSITVADWQHPRLLDGRDPYAGLPELIRQYREVVAEGDFCIDIGAHVGDSTLPMAIAAGPSGSVLALEPNPFVYHVLEKNARANRHVANISTMLAAAGSEQGFLEFEYSDSGFCNGGRHEGISAIKHGHPYKLSVFCVGLQQELQDCYAKELDRLKLIKVDAEGYDLYILRSLTGIIDEHRPIIKAEVFKNTSQEYRADLFDLFNSRNYAVFKMAEEALVKGERLDRQSVVAAGHFDILCFPE